MKEIKLKGNPIHIIGNVPAKGDKAPDFVLTKTDMSDVSLKDFKGKKLVLNIFPSIDTGVCAMSVRKFNEEAVKLENTVVLCVSEDLPFAHARFCSAEGIKNVVSVSDLRKKDFGETYGVKIVDGPIAGLLARAVIVIDEGGKVKYVQIVPEIAQEPDYAAAIAALKD
ncbi:MAG TPA: thiol peroxidase [Lentisphaeria bacterium]|nr:MAG: lipid hydroperoxide peroxidase [Lentisphaerae bacterium GWF2_50_93]HCE42171.1 thiol peroxidase [Lentisphaeria bacterium]